MLDNAVYSVVLDVNVGVEEKLGVKVGFEDFAYKSTESLEIGARCIAPLYNLEVHTQTMYTGFVIETPKPKDTKHGNDMRVLIFFDCGIWRYVHQKEGIVFFKYFKNLIFSF